MADTDIKKFHEGEKVYVQHRDGTRSYGRVIGFTPSGRVKVAGRGLVERGVDKSKLHRLGDRLAH